MSDIFISYNNQDRPRAQKFAEAFERCGWSVFWDRKIPVGQNWRDVIDKELGKAHCVIVLWSSASVSSPWVIEEAEDGEKRGILVSVRIDKVVPPRGFRYRQTADLIDWTGAEPPLLPESLTSAIAARIKRPVDGSLSAPLGQGVSPEEPETPPISQPAPKRPAAGPDLDPFPGSPRWAVLLGQLLAELLDKLLSPSIRAWERLVLGVSGIYMLGAMACCLTAMIVTLYLFHPGGVFAFNRDERFVNNMLLLHLFYGLIIASSWLYFKRIYFYLCVWPIFILGTIIYFRIYFSPTIWEALPLGILITGASLPVSTFATVFAWAQRRPD
jgi:hypothetical protein